MNTDGLQLARLAFLALNKTERREFLRTFSDPTPTAPATPETDRVVRRGEAARILARSPRAVDRLAADGALRRVMLPGRTRAAGFRLRDVQALIEGR